MIAPAFLTQQIIASNNVTVSEIVENVRKSMKNPYTKNKLLITVIECYKS